MATDNSKSFKPGVPTHGRRVPGFLKWFLCGRLYVYVCVFVCVCVSTPEVINN